MKYLICWKNDQTGHMACYYPPMDRVAAEREVNRRSKDWPGVRHWAEPVTWPTIPGGIPRTVLLVVFALLVIVIGS